MTLRWKRPFALLLTVCMAFSILCGSAWAAKTGADAAEKSPTLLETRSGAWDDHLTWTLDDEGTLTISGTGEMTGTATACFGYSGRGQIKAVVIEPGVTSIGTSAFYCCGGMTRVSIPNSVTSIGKYAFESCSGLTSVTIPDSVTSIGHYAFYLCKGLTSVSIPDSVTSIGSSAFSSCSALTSVTIPGSVTQIGGNAFYGTPWLREQGPFVIAGDNILIAYQGEGGAVTIPDGVTRIGDRAFYRCSSMTSVTIPNSVTSIGQYAFYSCSGLTSMNVPNNVTSIGQYAFYYCMGLTSITIPDSVTSIGYAAFSSCSGLTSVTIPDSVTGIGGRAFYYCSGLTSVTIPDGVTRIGARAFSLCSGLTSVTIPDSVTSIGYEAFSGCSGLTSVTIPGSVTKIDDRVFSGCRGLTDVTISDGVTKIGNYVFYQCSGLTSVTIPDSITSIGSGAFYDCSKLASVSIPDSVTSFGRDVFKSTEWLRLQAPFGIVNDGILVAYYGNDRAVTIPDGVTHIADGVFSGYRGLTSVTIPNTVTSIGNYAFYNCTGLTSVTIPDSVTSIGSYAFVGTPWLSEQGPFVIAGDSILIAYQGEDGVVTIPDGVTRIGDRVFSSRSSLTGVTIPDSVTSIGRYAFSGCNNLTVITAPAQFLNEGTVFQDTPWWKTRAPKSGMYGDNLTWTMDDEGTLTIRGAGEIGNNQGKPWYPHSNAIKHVVIEPGVTRIGSYAFSDSKFQTLLVPDGVQEVAGLSFGNLGRDDLGEPEREQSIYFMGSAPVFVPQMELASYDADEYSEYYAFDAYHGYWDEDYEFYCDVTVYYPEGDDSWTSDEVRRALQNVKLVPWNPADLQKESSLSDCTVELSQDSYVYDGTEKRPGVTVWNGEVVLTEGEDYTVSYENNLHAGTATVTLTGQGDYTNTVTWDFVIRQADLSDGVLTLSQETCIYDGKPKTPAVTVSKGGTVLTEELDYTVTYEDNNEPGTATVTVTGTGDYTGTLVDAFEIIARQAQKITAKSYTKTLGDKTFPIDAVTSGDGALTYASNNTEVATVGKNNGKVTLVGMGKATITITAKETAAYYPATKKIVVTVKAPTVKATSITKLSNVKGKKMAVKWKKVSPATGYQIQYTTDSKFKKSVKTVTIKKATTTSTTIAKVTKNKKYYVRIRTYRTVSKKYFFSAWCKTKAVAIKK